MRRALFLFIIIGVFGCKNSKNSDGVNVAGSDTVKIETAKFVRPEIPPLLTDPEQQFAFLIKHYWDHFDFADTANIPSSEITEQAWVDYIDLLSRAPLDKAQEEIKTMMLKSAQNSKTLFVYFTKMAEKYLYDPNSPVRNEELYIPILEIMIQTPALDDAEKMLPKHRLKVAHKNRIGTKAINFQYADIKEKIGTLYQINAEYILLFFNEPGCPSCRDHIAGIRNSAIINRLFQERRLKILSIYADEEVDKWREYHASYPAGWINGYDKSLTINKKYDLKATPTLYLLDKNKTVVLKDASVEQIENYLNFYHLYK